jgi:hypothetical protein
MIAIRFFVNLVNLWMGLVFRLHVEVEKRLRFITFTYQRE